MQIQHDNIDVNGVTLHVAQAGSGPLMLFLHGFPEFWYAWKRQLEHFGRDHLAVAPDMRGYNLSSKPAEVEQYRVPILVEDVRALAERFGYGRARPFVLVGHDWGGAVAWAYALAHPDTLDKLVIVNAPHPAVFRRELLGSLAQQKASAYMVMFRTPLAETTLSVGNYALLRNVVLREGLDRGYFTQEDEKAYLQAWSQPGALTGGLNYYRAARLGPPMPTDRDLSPYANAASTVVKVPTLVIWGEKDTALLTGNLDGIDVYVPQLTIRRIPDGTHWVIHQKPDLVNEYIRAYVTSQ